MTGEPEHGGTATAPELTRSGQYYRPAVDIVEDSQELRILADMPGVTADSVEIDFENGRLTILGRVAPRQAAEPNYLQNEYGLGDFHRVFQIGEAIDVARISAEYADGVLSVHLPKVAAAIPRKISVEAR